MCVMNFEVSGVDSVSCLRVLKSRIIYQFQAAFWMCVFFGLVFFLHLANKMHLFQCGQKVTYGKQNYFNGSHVVRTIQERVVESRCAICVLLCLLVHRCICFIVIHQYLLQTTVELFFN